MHAFRIGKLFGIDIRVDWSWVFIFVLMTWNLSVAFAQWHHDWPPAEYVGVAGVASVLFFGCILLHELAHSLVAMRFGLRVRSITLYLFGGVSNIEHEPPSAKSEFSTAIAGPLTSIALGVVFLAFAAIATAFSLHDVDSAEAAASRLGPLASLLVWLGPINIVIGLFNLVPAFPLDGGRVLRSILWGVSGDLRTATLRVSAIGQAIGWIFIVTGIAMSFGVRVPLFGVGVASGLWLAFVGWFVRSGAYQAQRRLALDDAMAGHTVGELMRRDGPAVSPDLTLTEFVHDYMVRSDERSLPVLANGKLVGMISVAEMRAVPPAAWSATRVGSLMQPRDSLVVASPGDALVDAFQELATRDIDQLAVLDHGVLVGLLKRRDVTRWLELAWGRVPSVTALAPPAAPAAGTPGGRGSSSPPGSPSAPRADRPHLGST
jgi:Zn-dependent protease/CBS domain-containing protein